MKIILLSILLFPLLSFSQDTLDTLSRYRNDTLYTSSGYKIYNGQILEFSKGTMRDGEFRYVTIKNGFLTQSLTNCPVLVTKIKKYTISRLGNGYIDLDGIITLKNGSKEKIVLHIAFDWAIENSPALPSELKVPDEFRNTRPRDIKKELITAKNLYEDRVIKKPEYERIKSEIVKQ